MDSSDTPIGIQNVGYLTICLSPSHKLSYADMERLQKKAEPRCATPQVLMHMTYEIKGNGIERVIYSVYEVGLQPLTLLQLKVDNLVDIMDGFTKLPNVFERNVSLTGASSVSVDEEKQVDTVNLQSARQQELEVLAREKASLTKCILELNRKL
ncbi:hypothetical protein LPMP_205900 [Leishmania panamensis]|uniref:Uncharacterized protein n=1 Tax=Leishmania panamensis TaxID=5679 RepID=A0A088S8X2_LEIPA|nr:hypothetical protein LPMP_205900 [Leishmania panamensis]AIN98081.1 hypothetical protein LPMP_205900 [Leishmania panamensis]